MLTGATSSKAFVLRVPDSVPTNGRTKNALLFVDRKGVVLVLVGSQGRSPRELRSRDLLNPSGLKKRLESWFIVGRFLSDHHWPVLGDHRGWPDPEGRRPAGRGVAHAHLQIGAGPPRCPCRSAVCAVILPSHPRILLQSPLSVGREHLPDRVKGYLEYLTVSTNRFFVRRWKRLLRSSGWECREVRGRAHPLALLIARAV